MSMDMNIHEYQAKQLFKEYNVSTLNGVVASNPSEAANSCKILGGNIWVVKAQVHAGGRGKGGGIIICKSTDEVYEAADKLIGSNLVTPQTSEDGVIVRRVYVEEGCNIARELYLGIVLDRDKQLPVVMASVEGGIDIEEIAVKNPEKILKIYADPITGIGNWQARKLAFALGLEGKQVTSCCNFIINLYRLFTNLDCSIVEINPLVVTSDNEIIALDAKINFDSSALFRHKEIEKLRDLDEEEPLESQANKAGLNYIKLDGNIGCMVNGAGLAMATMDIIKLRGGEPANFLDVGGGATPEKIVKAFRLIMMDKKVKVILVNIFAGINRCDWVAEGIVQALQKIEVNMPLVIRLAGTNVEKGNKILKESNLNYIEASTLEDAANKAVKALKELG